MTNTRQLVIAAIRAAIFAITVGLLSGCNSVSMQPAPAPQLPAISLPPDAEYALLAEHKAQAVSTAGNLRRTSNAHNQASPAAAALLALHRCREAQAQRATLAATKTKESPCELARANAAELPSSAELRAALPTQPHPLFLWQVSNATDSVYLAGSIHMLPESLLPPPRQFTAAFERSTILVLELDRSAISPAAMIDARDHYGLLPEGQFIWDYLSSAETTTLKIFLDARGIAPKKIERYKPALLAVEIGVAENIALGYLPRFGLESYFEQRRDTRSVAALETLEQQLAALTALPIELQAQVLMEDIESAAQIRSQTLSMTLAWMGGDTQALAAMFDAQSVSLAAQRWLDDLLTKRNRIMSDGIEKLLRNKQQAFVLVGAAHLAGIDSVIDLLQRRGFSIKQIASDHNFD